MKNSLALSAACLFVLASIGSAMAEEPGQLVVRQASVGTLSTHQVANDVNLFAAYFQPAPYAYADREQFNVDIWNNMSGWQWASSYVITYQNGTAPYDVLGGAEWTTNEQIQIATSTQTPIFLRFDQSSGSDYVLVVDRAMTDMAVRVAGDVDGDGELTIEDANLIAAAGTGLEQLSRIETAVADVNCDNSVSIVDALKVARIVQGLDAPGCN